MPLSDFQSSQERQTVAEWNAAQRIPIRLRHILLAFGLGFVAAVLLME